MFWLHTFLLLNYNLLICSRFSDNSSHPCTATDSVFLFWQQFLWQMDNRPDIVLGGLNHWLLPAEFMRGVDCISPGACERKIEKASLTLRHIMNRNEVPVSEVEGCKRSEKRWQTAWNGKVIKKNLNKARIIFNHFTCVYFDVFTYTGVQFLLIDLLSDHEQLFFLFI